MKNSNYLVFVDEAGDHQLGKYPKDFPMFVLAFVIISKDEYCDRLLPRFTRLKLKYFPDVNTIFHERDIRHFERRFEIFRGNRELYETFMSDLSALMSEIDYKVVAVAVNKDEKAKQGILADDLYELGVKYGLAAIEEFLKSKDDFNYTTITFESRAYSVDVYRNADKALYNYFKKTACDRFGISIQVKSAGGLGLQFADMMARPIGIHTLRPEQSNRAWDVIEGKIWPGGFVELPKK